MINMGQAITIKIEGLKELEKSFDKSPQMTKRVMGKAMDLSTERIKNTAKTKAPVDTGALRGSIKNKVNIGIRDITGVVDAGKKYAPYVEFGTLPHFPPPMALRSWARKRGINEFALAKAISRRGTKAQPFMQPAITSNKLVVGQIFDSALGALVAQLAK